MASYPSATRAAAGALVLLQLGALLLVATLTFPLIDGWHRGDLRLYYQAGLRLLQGELPYRDFPIEYPPGALIPFVLPHLAALGRRLSLTSYSWSMLIQSAVFSSIVALTLARLVAVGWPRRSPLPVLAVYALYVGVGASLLPWRYDLFPAMLALLALLGVLAGRPFLGGLCLGLGVAAKLYPLVLLPIFGLYYLIERRPRALVSLLLGTGLAIGLALLPFLSLGLATWLPTLGFYGVRGLQIETLPGGLLLLGNLLGLWRVGVEKSLGAYHLTSPLAEAAVAWQPVALGLAYAAVLASTIVRFRQDRTDGATVPAASLTAAAALAVLAFIATNKVFSAQHLIWVLPFAPLLPLGRAALLLGAWGLTNLLFPWHYEGLTDGHRLPVLIVNLRNVLVLLLIIWLLAEPWAVAWRHYRRRRRAVARSTAERGVRAVS